jgi:ubiquitin-like 1-activating enzyme E1 A
VTRAEEVYVSYAAVTTAHKLSALSARERKRWPPAAHGVHLLQRFRDQHGRLPSTPADDAEHARLAAVYAAYLAWHGMAEAEYPLTTLVAAAAGARAELAPVTAVVGGALAQEVLKAVSGKELPWNNHFFFDGLTGAAQVHRLG